jgi:Icc-related predicted phosphoesterase
MKIICISDTHNRHDTMPDIPDGDILVCAGDHTGNGSLFQLIQFNQFLGTLPHRHKVFIAGNHDWCFQRNREASEAALTNAIYLEDRELIIEGIKLYGSPWQPEFYDWAFNLLRGEQLKAKWDRIPVDTDILITHGPPMGILDAVRGMRVGCEMLLEAVERIKPQAHIFGHIHESYGLELKNGTTFINASICNGSYLPINPPLSYCFDEQAIKPRAIK